MQAANFFKITAEILSLPVALLPSNLVSNFLQARDLKTTISSNWFSGEPKKGVSTTSAGNFALSEKVRANVSAFFFASVSHPLPSRRVGIEDVLAFFLNNSRLIRHHCLLCRLRFCSFNLIHCTCFARSSPKICIHLNRSASKRFVLSAPFLLHQCSSTSLVQSRTRILTTHSVFSWDMFDQ